ncbi:1060_t:CDS:2, partial [Gigaspora margarita]
AYRHPAWVAIAGVSHIDTQEHPDGHYCLASVKYAKQFVSMFADMSVIISQDDKAKVGLGVLAVGQTFRTLQSINEPVVVADHDFPIGYGQKLISSVYLIIKPNKLNDELRTGELAIFICSQALLKFDLDYLSVRTHAPEQSKYNPVERRMPTLSGKLAEILCDTWSRDLIFGKHVHAQYIDTFMNPFDDLQFKGTEKEKIEELKRQEKQKKKYKKKDEESDIPECFILWSWIESHYNLCAYFVNIKKCKNINCCRTFRAKEAMKFLECYNGFLPPVTRAKDGHYANPIHMLQYYDLLKILGYDFYCPSFEKNSYSRFCCPTCQKYFPTLAFLINHKKAVHPSVRGRPKA